MTSLNKYVALVVGSVLAVSCAPLEVSDVPDTEMRPVVDTYHDVQVTDSYRWLENWEDDDVQAWSERQNTYARSILDDLPAAEPLRARLSEVLGDTSSTSQFWLSARGGRLFAMKFQPPIQQPFLVWFESPDDLDTATVLVDPIGIDPSASTTIDWYMPSPDGSLVAVSMSKSGSEVGDLSIFETATGSLVYETIPHVNGGTAGGDLAWIPDSSGFFYSRYPRQGERAAEDMNFYQQLWFHELGRPIEEDRYELGEKLPKIAEIRVEMHDETGRLLVTVQNGDGGEFEHYIRQSDGVWSQFSDFDDEVVEATFGPSGELFVLSFEDAPKGKLLLIDSVAPDMTDAKLILPEGEGSLESSFYAWFSPSFLATESRLFAIYQVGGPTELRVFDLGGRAQTTPEQLEVSTIYSLTPLGGDDIMFANQSFIDPKLWLRYDGESGETTQTELSSSSPVAFNDLEVIRDFALSKDGTQVPLNIIRPKGARQDGSSPVLVTGYGGYGVSQSPFLVTIYAPLLEQGFAIVKVNLRGGSEYGNQWHEQGRLTEKQNVFDDFAAAIEHLVAEGYADPAKVAILGGSNGGLLMGALMTQHPRLAQAVISFVGIYDMLRVELSPNGQFNIPEFGTVENPDHFEAMYAYSPYHRVVAGTSYPATLFLTGANDPRVDPMHSRKMTALLQAAQGGSGPILLRTDANAGHGIGSSVEQTVEEYTDAFAFVMDAVDVTYKEGN